MLLPCAQKENQEAWQSSWRFSVAHSLFRFFINHYGLLHQIMHGIHSTTANGIISIIHLSAFFSAKKSRNDVRRTGASTIRLDRFYFLEFGIEAIVIMLLSTYSSMMAGLLLPRATGRL